jgi:biopolymer transport protein ExbB/TolQ
MDPAIASIVVAVIGLVGTITGIAIKEFKDMKNKNSADHGAVMLKLNKVQDSVEKVGERLDDHIDWHLKK